MCTYPFVELLLSCSWEATEIVVWNQGIRKQDGYSFYHDWPTSHIMETEGVYKKIVKDLDGPHVMDFEAGVVRRDVVHDSMSPNLMSHDFAATCDEQPVQQVDLQPAGQTCQIRVPIGGPRPSSHSRSQIQPPASPATTNMRSRVLGKRQHDRVSRGPLSTQGRELESKKRPPTSQQMGRLRHMCKSSVAGDNRGC